MFVKLILLNNLGMTHNIIFLNKDIKFCNPFSK